METERFVQFPLYLLRELFTDKDVFNKILAYGIYRYSKKFDFNIREVGKQCMYGYYNKHLPNELNKLMLEYIDKGELSEDLDYKGFSPNGKNFEPDDSVNEIMGLFQKDERLNLLSIEYYQLHMALSSLKIKNGSIDHIINSAKKIEASKPENDPMPMINVKMLFNFRDKPKFEFEIAQLAAFIAVKSIIGVNAFYKTNKAMIVSRMFGYASTKHLPASFMHVAVSNLFKKYSNRYHIGLVLQALQLNWNVVSYNNNTHGLFMAIGNKISLNDLALRVEMKSNKNKIKTLSDKKK